LALVLVALGGLAVGVASAQPVTDTPVTIAALRPGDAEIAREAPLPAVLSAADAALYKRIFALQEDGHWPEADKAIKKLGDRILMGQVLAQRYLHPTRYRSKFRELRDWLKLYADHPQAARIYKLALRRKPKSARLPRAPILPRQPPAARSLATPLLPDYISPRRRTPEQRRAFAKLVAHIKRHLRRRQAAGAAKHLKGDELRALADPLEFDILRGAVAHAFFIKGDDERALALANASVDRSGTLVPLAAWVGGLAGYRSGDYEVARRDFEIVAAADGIGEDLHAAGAYWAARLDLITRRPERVSRFLRAAANHPRSFYGLLALRALGEVPDFTFAPPPLTDRDMAIVTRVPAAMRAIALAQIGQDRRAEAELKRLDPGRAPALDKAILALATRIGAPSAQFRIARRLTAADGRRHDGTMYPLLPWRPESGYRVDRALIHAIVRKESAFNARARSGAGARGLMQLMPRTAAFVARGAGERKRLRRRLYDPAFNLELGQRYVLYLLGRPAVAGNLLYLAAAYNGGPGNLRKWRRDARRDDPLMFIESLPARETRVFIERVMSNFWIYRARLGQPTPTLDAIVAGDWPIYTALDREPRIADARN